MLKPLARLVALAALVLIAPRLSAQGKFVIVVNPANPVTKMSQSQISKIYLGKLQAWDINGKIQPVSPVDLKTDSPVRALFAQKILRKTVSETTSYWRQELYAGRNVPPPEQTEAEALQTVRNSVGAIAYVSEKADLKGVKVVMVP